MKTSNVRISKIHARRPSAGSVTASFAVLFSAVLLGGVSVQAAINNWIGSADNNYTNPAAWSAGSVPGIADTAYIGNSTLANATVLYTNLLSDPLSTNKLSLLEMNTNAGTSTFTMTDGVLLITNASGNALTLGTFNGAVDTFSQSGGTLVVARPSNSSLYYQDAFQVGGTGGATGTFSISGGLAASLCGLEISGGNPSTGTFTVSGGTVIDNGWFGVGRGNNGNGTFNLSSGTLYILRNMANDGTGNAAGLSISQGVPDNGTANISGGNLYCTQIRFNSSAGSTETLNVSGGNLYVGYIGVYSSGVGASQINTINISGGTFHTADMLAVTNNNNTIGNTSTILSDGTNWSWSAQLSVNLTNGDTFLVNGQTGPGYVTFAPEATRTITLNNVWSGVGSLVMNGPGTLAMSGASTYTGDTTISQGRLALTGSGSIASPNIIVAGGATFDTTAASSFNLSLGQTLTNSSFGAVVNGLNTGSGTVSLVYDGSTPSLTTASGTLTLNSGTTFNVNNTGAALAVGNYTIISSTGGTVAGTLPSVTVSGDGITAGAAASLYISGGELYLSVAAAPVINSQIPSNNISLYESQNFTFSVNASGAGLSYQWYTNGVADAAETGSTYALTDVQQAISGVTYQCIVTNSLGAATNQEVTLTVLPLPSFLTSSAYSTSLLALRPTAYWPMHQTNAPAPGDIETNYGTLGALGNGYYADWDVNNGNPGNQVIQHQVSGALANDSDGAAYFNFNGSTNSYLLVPHTSPGTTLTPPFTIECWVKGSSVTKAFGDMVSEDGTKLNTGNDNNVYGIRLAWGGNAGASPNVQVYVGSGGLGFSSPAAITTTFDQWHYVALTCDLNGGTTNYTLYVDNSTPSSKTGSGFAPDSWDPLTIGNGLWNGGGPTRASTDIDIDEVAIYTTALDSGTISTHYSDGLSGEAGQYFADVTSLNPVLYYRMDAPAYTAPANDTWPVLTNYGTVPVNGVYPPGTTPGGVSGPTDADGNWVTGLSNTNAAPGNGMNPIADAGYDPAFDPTGPTPVTISVWFKGNPTDSRFQNMMGHSDHSWRLSMNTNGKLQCQLGTNSSSLINSAKVYNDGQWHQVVEVYTPASDPNVTGTNALYVDGVLDTAVSTVSTNGIGPGSPDDILLGADPQYLDANNGVGRQFAGNICEAALWNGTALTSDQVNSLYAVSGQDHPPVVANIVTNSAASGVTDKIAISVVHAAAGWSDPDGDTVTFNSVASTSANGASMTSDANYIYYNAAVTTEDHFDYTVTDGHLTTTGTVYLEPVAATEPTVSNPAVDGNGHPTFSGLGISNYTYGVESTTDLVNGPWIEAGTLTAGADGSWSFTDASQTNPVTIFYRLYYPDNPGSPPQ